MSENNDSKKPLTIDVDAETENQFINLALANGKTRSGMFLEMFAAYRGERERAA